MTDDPDRTLELPFTLNLRKVNLVVGYTALLLPVALLLVTLLTDTCFNASISHYYFSRIGGDILVGSLSMIGALLLFFYVIPAPVDGYSHHKPIDMIALRIAGLAAFGIAFVPTSGTGCDFSGEVARAFLSNTAGSVSFPYGDPPVTGDIGFDIWASFGIEQGWVRLTHLTSAAVMFLVLAYFSYFVFTRPNSASSVTPTGELSLKKHTRNWYYRVLGVVILLCIVAIAAVSLLLGEDSGALRFWDGFRLTFVLEAIALMAFGLSWLIKGRFIKHFEDA